MNAMPSSTAKANSLSADIRHAELVTVACRAIESSAEPMSLDQLAELVHMSPHHFHRVFKAVTGLTPKAYANAHRSKKFRDELTKGQSVTSAIYDAGFGSDSRLYEAVDQVLGMTPKDYRKGGEDTTIRFAVAECSLGSILVAQTERGVCAIFLGDDPDALVKDLQDRFPKANLIGADAKYEKVVAQVIGFIESPKLGLNLPLDLRGTAFQQRVWRALQAIPPGKTVSYTDIAKAIDSPASVRAVASACGANPVAVAVPCHRVLRRDGSLSGYRWGVERKRELLAREG